MNQLCYTLEEAAEKLKLSETVLVRLSQYFKVPKAAYEEVGYLSFKGDLAFSEPDLTFFRKVKERLVIGESLDDIKRHAHEDMAPQWQQVQPTAEGLGASELVDLASQEAPGEPAEQAPDQYELEATGPIRDIQDRQPYEKAAEQSFERYKSMHRSGLGKIFENMLKEVGSAATKKRAGASTPGFKPMRNKLDLTGKPSTMGVATKRSSTGRSEKRMPFVRDIVKESSGQGAGNSWTHMVHAAASQPRALNTQLKSAAQLLRERAMGKPEQEKSS